MRSRLRRPRGDFLEPVTELALLLHQVEVGLETKEESLVEVEVAREPQVRFRGLPGEQATLFFLDPSGNALEFKAFADDARVFAR